jgi:hypothetical protein
MNLEDRVMQHRFKFLLLLGTLTLTNLIYEPTLGECFNDNAHIQMSDRAVNPQLNTNPSILDNFLKTTLGFEFPNGINENLVGGEYPTVSRQIQFGAIREDAGLRVRNHFHNPRLPWNQAGMGLPFTESSIVWAQNPNQLSFDKRSWNDARNYYFQALTETPKSERKRLYAETFRTLGHQIHHVQDAATPSHTRNDWHLSFEWLFGLPDPDEFHYWGESVAGQGVINSSQPAPFNTGLVNQSGANPNAPVPIARIIDSTDGDIGTLALTPGISMGLAEYSSANFFSDDTINSPNFLSPRADQVEVKTEADLSTPPRQRPYVYFKPSVGDTSYPLALASAMFPYVIDPLATPTENGLDNKVFKGYGEKLFPRAISYSAGLIDYFFRGKIDATPWSPGFVNVPWGAQSSSIVVENISVKFDGTNEQAGNGTMRLVLNYVTRMGGAAKGPDIVVSQPVSVSGISSQQTLVFPFDSLPFPLTSPALSGSHIYQYGGLLVYKGATDQESEAVVVDGYCIDPDTGSKYLRTYQLEHSAPGVWFDEGGASIDYLGC